METLFKLYRQFLILFVLATFTGTVFGPHDHGQGRSQDHAETRAVAPEPLSIILFLTGSGMLVAKLRKVRSEDQDRDTTPQQ